MRKKMIKGVSKQILEVTNTDNPYLVKVADIVYQAHVQDIGWQDSTIVNLLKEKDELPQVFYRNDRLP